MREILSELTAALDRGEECAMSTVVRTWRSAPRPAGASMLVTAGGEAVGSVSGGCVEGAVVAEALAILAGESAPRVVTFGYSDDEAFSVGLTCGGTVHLFIQELLW